MEGEGGCILAWQCPVLIMTLSSMVNFSLLCNQLPPPPGSLGWGHRDKSSSLEGQQALPNRLGVANTQCLVHHQGGLAAEPGDDVLVGSGGCGLGREANGKNRVEGAQCSSESTGKLPSLSLYLGYHPFLPLRTCGGFSPEKVLEQDRA